MSPLDSELDDTMDSKVLGGRVLHGTILNASHFAHRMYRNIVNMFLRGKACNIGYEDGCDSIWVPTQKLCSSGLVIRQKFRNSS